MNRTLRQQFANLHSQDRQIQHDAFMHVLKATDKRVDWAYEVWDSLLQDLTHKDNHVRAIAGQVLCNLAKSDPKNRMQHDFEALLKVTRDERFVTARHTLLALWKIGVVGPRQRKLLLDGLDRRFRECIREKNCTLIRFDIIQDLRELYDAVKDEQVKAKALAWIETERDLKHRKKYAAVWRRRAV